MVISTMQGERAVRVLTVVALFAVAIPTACGGEVEGGSGKSGGSAGTGATGGKKSGGGGFGGGHYDAAGYGGMDAAPYGGGGWDGAPPGGWGGGDGAPWGGADGIGFGGSDGGPPGGWGGVDGAAPGGSGGALDASVDGTPSCIGLDETACLLEVQKQLCSAYYGSNVPGGGTHFVLCDAWCIGLGGPTCALDPSGVCWMFPNSCVPSGWSGASQCNFDAAPACAILANDGG